MVSTIPVTLDHRLLSDKAGKGDGANFTGTFVGTCCPDLSAQKRPADFGYFLSRERDSVDALDGEKS